MFQIIQPAPPATPAMRLRDLRSGLRGYLILADKEATDAWAMKGPGRCLSIRDVLKDFVRYVEEHEMRLGELTEMLESSGSGVPSPGGGAECCSRWWKLRRRFA